MKRPSSIQIPEFIFVLGFNFTLISHAIASPVPLLISQENNLKEANSLENKVEILYKQGQYEQAINLAEKIVAIRRKFLNSVHPDLATALNNLAFLYKKQAKYSKAKILYEESLNIFRKSSPTDYSKIAKSLNNLASLHQAQGNYSKAELIYREAITINRKHLPSDHPEIAENINNLAGLYQLQGHLKKAEILYLDSINIIRKLSPNNHSLLVNKLNNLAGLYAEQGRYSEAEKLYEETIKIVRKSLPKNHPNLASSLNNLALLYTDQRRYFKAAILYKELISIVWDNSPKNHPSTALYLNSLAEFYRRLSNHSEAEKLYKEAIKVARRILPDNHPVLATYLNNLAVSYQNNNRFLEAGNLLKESLKIRQKSLPENHPDIAINLNNLALLYKTEGHYSEAESYFKQALEIGRKALPENHPNLANYLNGLAEIYWIQKDLPKTFQSLHQGLDIEEENLARNLVVGNEQQKKAFLSGYKNSMNAAISSHHQLAPKHLPAARLAFTTTLRRKGRLLDILGQSFQKIRNSSSPSVKKQLAQLSEVQSQLARLTLPRNSPKQHQQTLKKLVIEQQKLTNSLNNANPELNQAFEPITIDQVQHAIPNNAALVEFIEYYPFEPTAKPQDSWSPSRYAVYTLTPQGELRWQDLGPVSEIDPLIKNFVDQIRDKSFSENEIRPAAQDLEAQIMQPVRKLVGTATHLLIAPDGELNRIPFEALMDEQGRYLIQDYQFTYLTSGRDLIRLQNPLPKSEKPLLLAYPTYDQRGLTAKVKTTNEQKDNQHSSDLASLQFDALPGTLAEGQAIAQAFPQFRFYKEKQATETIIKENANPRILHIATHGFFLNDLEPTKSINTLNNFQASQSAPLFIENPLLRSGLALAGSNIRDKSTSGDDGILTALEISGLDLRATEMVVMSACETGVGQIENGEGVYGLRRAFTLAGARSQLMSLWKVDDAGTKELMVAYYDRLKQGKGRASALREVQLAMLEGKLQSKSGQSYSVPYYWAAFVRVGDWRPINGL